MRKNELNPASWECTGKSFYPLIGLKALSSALPYAARTMAGISRSSAWLIQALKSCRFSPDSSCPGLPPARVSKSIPSKAGANLQLLSEIIRQWLTIIIKVHQYSALVGGSNKLPDPLCRLGAYLFNLLQLLICSREDRLH